MREAQQGFEARYLKLVTGVAVLLLFFAGVAFAILHRNHMIAVQFAAPSQQVARPANANPWQLRCSPRPNSSHDAAKQVCEAFQRLSVAKTGQRVVEFAVSQPNLAGSATASKSVASAVIILPLGLLTEDLQMQIDQRPATRFNIAYCTEAGCFALFTFDRTDMAALQNGHSLMVTAQSFQKRSVVIKLSLSGLSAALGATN